jgi:hypothetical protein
MLHEHEAAAPYIYTYSFPIHGQVINDRVRKNPMRGARSKRGFVRTYKQRVLIKQKVSGKVGERERLRVPAVGTCNIAKSTHTNRKGLPSRRGGDEKRGKKRSPCGLCAPHTQKEKYKSEAKECIANKCKERVMRRWKVVSIGETSPLRMMGRCYESVMFAYRKYWERESP